MDIQKTHYVLSKIQDFKGWVRFGVDFTAWVRFVVFDLSLSNMWSLVLNTDVECDLYFSDALYGSLLLLHSNIPLLDSNTSNTTMEYVAHGISLR